MTLNKKWTDKDVEFIKANLNKPASFIADKLDRTRNSVIGKIHRLGLRQSDYTPIEPPKKIKRTQPSKNGFNGNLSLLDIQNGQCRYSTDTGQHMMCCGDKVHKQYAYCEKHCNVMFREGWEKMKPIKPRPEWREGIFY